MSVPNVYGPQTFGEKLEDRLFNDATSSASQSGYIDTQRKSFSESLGEWWRNVSGARAADEFSASEAQKQRDFEERMSSSAYQRAVADMAAAGLNPGMMYSSGGGPASTPSGASAHGTASGSGGLIGLVGRMAMIAISRGLANRIFSSVNGAPSVPGATSAAKKSLHEVSNMFKPDALDEAHRISHAVRRAYRQEIADEKFNDILSSLYRR